MLQAHSATAGDYAGEPLPNRDRSLVTQLKEALKKTELTNCWGNMLGVLWWILMSK
jgi:hypothetical protein